MFDRSNILAVFFIVLILTSLFIAFLAVITHLKRKKAPHLPTVFFAAITVIGVIAAPFYQDIRSGIFQVVFSSKATPMPIPAGEPTPALTPTTRPTLTPAPTTRPMPTISPTASPTTPTPQPSPKRNSTAYVGISSQEYNSHPMLLPEAMILDRSVWDNNNPVNTSNNFVRQFAGKNFRYFGTVGVLHPEKNLIVFRGKYLQGTINGWEVQATLRESFQSSLDAMNVGDTVYLVGQVYKLDAPVIPIFGALPGRPYGIHLIDARIHKINSK